MYRKTRLYPKTLVAQGHIPPLGNLPKKQTTQIDSFKLLHGEILVLDTKRAHTPLPIPYVPLEALESKSLYSMAKCSMTT